LQLQLGGVEEHKSSEKSLLCRSNGRRLQAIQERFAVCCLAGLTPRQNSSGGKSSLGSIIKRGDSYLRTLLIQGAKAVVLTGKYNLDLISQWAISLRQRAGWQKAVVALANKNARILWALMTHQRSYEATHISSRPSAALA
jgi:hypothetical protein